VHREIEVAFGRLTGLLLPPVNRGGRRDIEFKREIDLEREIRLKRDIGLVGLLVGRGLPARAETPEDGRQFRRLDHGAGRTTARREKIEEVGKQRL
jgi:hypothetical protein